jgi:hypothetical protein
MNTESLNHSRHNERRILNMRKGHFPNSRNFGINFTGFTRDLHTAEEFMLSKNVLYLGKYEDICQAIMKKKTIPYDALSAIFKFGCHLSMRTGSK